MNTSRRNFIKTGTVALAGAAFMPKNVFARPAQQAHLVGVQLYSVREAMGKKPLETLQGLAKMGYKHVEHAGYKDRKFYGYTAADFKKVLGDLGMTMPSGHTVMRKQHIDEANNGFTKEWMETIEDAAIVGQEYVISPWMDDEYRKSEDAMKGLMDWFNKCGEACQKQGMKFGYHNHDFEFSTMLNNKTLYDIILQNTDPNLVIQQLDIGNMYGTGARGVEFIRNYPGRFQSLHVKDEIKTDKKEGSMAGHESTILGKGLVDVKAILALAKEMAGTRHYIIEQEAYQGKDPMDCMKEDLKIMKQWGYA